MCLVLLQPRVLIPAVDIRMEHALVVLDVVHARIRHEVLHGVRHLEASLVLAINLALLRYPGEDRGAQEVAGRANGLVLHILQERPRLPRHLVERLPDALKIRAAQALNLHNVGGVLPPPRLQGGTPLLATRCVLLGCESLQHIPVLHPIYIHASVNLKFRSTYVARRAPPCSNPARAMCFRRCGLR